MPLSNLQVIHNNRYGIDALLGQGGMGAVYRAMDLSLNIPVAIKENLDGSPYPPRELNRNISPMAEEAILKAIEVATERRSQSVSELRAALVQPVAGVISLQPANTPSAC
jgi:hypothetical protein